MAHFVFSNRAVISVSGTDQINFLQGIISNDVHKLSQSLYTLILTSTGKVFCDAFIFKDDDQLLLDVPKPSLTSLLKKLMLYKLNSSVMVTDLSNHFSVIGSFERSSTKELPDPRSSYLGYRSFMQSSQVRHDCHDTKRQYDQKRLDMSIPDMPEDIEPELHFPLELGFDKLNAIDYHKGCYIGQEVVARTTHLGRPRKGLYQVTCTTNQAMAKHSNITYQEKIIGKTLGTAFGHSTMAILDHKWVAEAESLVTIQIEGAEYHVTDIKQQS
ncbi:hypothetical protein EDM53_04540 [Rickettsiales endosymbiont of Peranema trichophorum]|uniref:CAF17-like 4Fe-4S cluster assembly/insertion protein YgfZ n=1 Tax=Rickettsiales endosymbiont of Peranema trichophorum TaxID=2486577 RepID=UPI00102320C0|nr:hypothetical protein [Rickettsiales endosymbiont of Peranema trichophorum]RZI45996.1 hypothetical protein EDM53_04540 [Rickettsiales endosymbiont of Peranema trichophorum]